MENIWFAEFVQAITDDSEQLHSISSNTVNFYCEFCENNNWVDGYMYNSGKL